MTRETIHHSRHSLAAVLALLVPMLAGSNCSWSLSASGSSGDQPDASVVGTPAETPAEIEQPRTEEELAIERTLEAEGRRIAEYLQPGPHDDDGDGLVDREIEETSIGDTITTFIRSGRRTDRMVYRNGSLIEGQWFFSDGRPFREKRTIETDSKAIEVEERDSNGDGVTDFVSTRTYDKATRKAWIKTEMLQMGQWNVVGNYDATKERCSKAGLDIGSPACPKVGCEERGERESCRPHPNECCPSGTNPTYAPIGQEPCCQIKSPANWTDDSTLRPIPGVPNAKIYVANILNTSQGPDSGRCTARQFKEVLLLFSFVIKESMDCLKLTNFEIHNALYTAIKSKRLRIGCGYCGLGSESIKEANSMNLAPEQLDESSHGGPARETMKQIILHELLHWAGERHAGGADGEQTGRPNEGTGVDRVYACGRTCGSCIAIEHAGCYKNQTSIGDTQFDCSRCADTDPLARWVYCGSRVTLDNIDSGSAVIVPASCEGLLCAKKESDEVVYASPEACGRRPHMTCDFYDESESPPLEIDTISDCIDTCSSGYEDAYLMVEGAEPEASCSYQNVKASRSEYPWDRCNYVDSDPFRSADKLCGFVREVRASPHDM